MNWPAADDEVVAAVPIRSLVVAGSPRLAGEDPEHTRLLAESGAALPPILVHRPTRRVIDGLHRLRAAALLGHETIAVNFFDGTIDDAFVRAVRANVTHGLPLSLADRKTAAARIVVSHPQWSDRAIGSATGLAGKTVGVIRRRTRGDTPDVPVRIGRDGRVRPVDSLAGRRVAGDLLATDPAASLQAVARAAGISPATVRDVRSKMLEVADPPRPRGRPRGHHGGGAPSTIDRASVLRNLTRDPSLRFTDSGRALLRWLSSRADGLEGWLEFISAIPPHCSYALADLARASADEWLEFARRLDERAGTTA
jgi:ParB-like chromosome segregation protein Spo0J